MNILEVFKSAFRGIGSNKVRSALTLLGVLIGVGSVILLTGVGNGSAQSVASSIGDLGTNTLTVRVQSASTVRFQTLDEGAVAALRDQEQVSNVVEVVPEVNSSQTVSSNTASSTATVIGSTAEYFDVNNYNIALGTGFSDYEEQAAVKVVVIGPTLAETLFSTTDVVGESITVGASTFTINGVLEETSSSGINDQNSTIVMPLERMQRSITGYSEYSSLTLTAASADAVDAAMAEATAALDTYFQVGEDEDSPVSITSQTQLLETLSSTTNTLTSMLTAVAAISLIVAGIGVMNIMLVTVTERTREIGIRKALGATPGVILGQFLIEATVLCLIGGILGMVCALIASNFEFWGVQPVLGATSIAIAIGVSVVIGVFFGSYPAKRAAAMRPVDALRHD